MQRVASRTAICGDIRPGRPDRSSRQSRASCRHTRQHNDTICAPHDWKGCMSFGEWCHTMCRVSVACGPYRRYCYEDPSDHRHSFKLGCVGDVIRFRPRNDRHTRFAGRDNDDPRNPASAAGPEIRRRHQGRRAAIEAVVGAARRAAEGRAERVADHHRRFRLRRAEHLRRRHSDADHGPHCEPGPALQPRVLDRPVLADARRTDHRAQSSLGRLRRDLRAIDRLPRLQQRHRQGQGDGRAHSA